MISSGFIVCLLDVARRSAVLALAQLWYSRAELINEPLTPVTQFPCDELALPQEAARGEGSLHQLIERCQKSFARVNEIAVGPGHAKAK